MTTFSFGNVWRGRFLGERPTSTTSVMFAVLRKPVCFFVSALVIFRVLECSLEISLMLEDIGKAHSQMFSVSFWYSKVHEAWFTMFAASSFESSCEGNKLRRSRLGKTSGRFQASKAALFELQVWTGRMACLA